MNPVELPDAFVTMQTVLDAYPKGLKDKPRILCRSLLQQGHQDALLKLDNTTRSRLGPDVETLLRGVKVVQLMDAPETERPSFLLQEGGWVEKDIVRAGVLAHLDLVAMEKFEGGDGGLVRALPKFMEAKDMLRQRLMDTLGNLEASLQQEKANLSEVHSDLKALVDLAFQQPEWLAQDITVNLVKKYNDQPQALEKCAAGKVLFLITVRTHFF